MAVQAKDIITVTIETIAFGGEGLGRVETLVVFVPFTTPGDVVEVEIREAKKRYLRGRMKGWSRRRLTGWMRLCSCR